MSIFQRIIAITLSLSLFMLPIGVAQSAIIGNAQLIDQARGHERAVLLEALEREQVHQYLTSLGADAEQVKARLAQMTDQEIATLSQRLGDLPAGGDALGVILVVFIVFVVTDAIGATDIFPFVHPVR
ncbi:MAG: PA2779 family protein [Candidatus Thiodiazotropha sp. (ex Gloverina cf. vestifex)]|nr:PA2779 family protein [Candidatus Thiodiazotropha sp. (ex Gloverina cf. vestifex)]